jgi:hypothetical protein
VNGDLDPSARHIGPRKRRDRAVPVVLLVACGLAVVVCGRPGAAASDANAREAAAHPTSGEDLVGGDGSAAVLLPAAPATATASRGPRSEDVNSAPRAPGEPVALGRVLDAGPGAPSLSLLTAAGYGYTGAVLGSGDRHDRMEGRLAVEGRVRPWLGLGFRFDGRSAHPRARRPEAGRGVPRRGARGPVAATRSTGSSPPSATPAR